MIIKNPLNYEGQCIIICDRNIILKNEKLPDFEDLLKIKSKEEDGVFFIEDTFNICVLELKSFNNTDNEYTTMYLREFFSTACEDEVFKVSRAKALIGYVNSNVYCSVCASKLEDSKKETVRICPKCNKTFYPKIEPCIIMRIVKDGKILLANHSKRNQDIYACIAGFVEAGETLEQACIREVYEETQIKIKNIKYLGSQSWPFPSQLMLAFSAEYESGEIKVQEDEIKKADWFDVNNLPNTPMRGSISYQLIHFEI